MCGIAVIFDSRLPAVRAVTGCGDLTAHPLGGDIRAMTAALSRRGPDATGYWVSGPVALGATRLSILDLSEAGYQPMSKSGRYWIVFNGEVYNYLEIRQELELYYRFETRTDTEVILAAYDRWGEKCLEHFNGMFAFIVWDSKDRIAFGARDRLGVKPLYYTKDEATGTIAFASEIKALRTLGWCRGGPNPQRLFDFLLDRVSDHTSETMFKDVKQLRPGCKFVWSVEKGLQTSEYWRYEPTCEQDRGETICENFHDLFSDSVRVRLRSDVPIGSLVSGGLDSSSVFCMAREHSRRIGKQLFSFSTRVWPRTDENAMIDLLVKDREPFHSEDTPSKQGFETDIHDLIYAQEEPFADGSMLAHFRLMRLARDAGVKVLLSGQGGDEFWDGYYDSIWNFLASLVRQGRAGDYGRWACGFRRRYRLALLTMGVKTLRNTAGARLVDFYQERSFRCRSKWLSRDFFMHCYRSRESEPCDRNGDPYRRYLRNIATSWTLPGFLHYEDRNSMFFGVEVRSPFLDYRLVEYAARLSPELKMRNCETKYIVRSSLRGITPDEILDRHQKEPFPAPIEKWLRGPNGVLDELAERSQAVFFVKSSAVQSTIRRYRNGDRRVATRDVWRMVCTILWYCRFFTSEYS